MALSECDLIRIRRHEDLDRVERLKLNIDGWTSDDRKSVGEFLRESSYLSKFHRIFYVATPKVACTSVKWWFAGLEGCEDKIRAVVDTKETDADLSVHSAFRIVAPDVTGLVLEDLKEALESDSYFRFALVRNPYRRIFSAWQSKILLLHQHRTRLQAVCLASQSYPIAIDKLAQIQVSVPRTILLLQNLGDT